MKIYFTGLILLLVVISCNTKKKELPILEKKVRETGYIHNYVGVDEDGVYKVSDKDSVSYKWAAAVKTKFGFADNVQITGFKIVKVKTKGDAVEDAYLLMAKKSDNLAAVASVLYLKEKKFYFENCERGGVRGSEIIICKGDCGDEGCYPLVVVSGNHKKLICSSCSSCDKNISIIH